MYPPASGCGFGFRFSFCLGFGSSFFRLAQEKKVVDNVGILFLRRDLSIGAVRYQLLNRRVHRFAKGLVSGTEGDAVLLGRRQPRCPRVR